MGVQVGVRAGAQLAMEPELVPEMQQRLSQCTFAMRVFWNDVVTGASEGKLSPHVHVAVPLDRAKEAFRSLLNREVIGKAVIVPSATQSRL